MKLQISSYSQIPIYEQIKKLIQHEILTNSLKSDEQLPSIRQLAADLNVGIITVKRAYEDLEKEGFIYNRQGKGCFIMPINRAEMKQLHLKEMQKTMQQIHEQCLEKAITKEELLSLLEKEWRDEK